MSIDKKACGMLSDPGLSFNLGSGLLYAKQIDYLIRSVIKNIAGRRVLILYIYRREDAAQGCNIPQYTVFQTKDSYAALERNGDGTLKWRSACFDNLTPVYMFEKKCAFHSQKDERRVTVFCSIKDNTGLEALKKLQARIMSAQLRKRKMARARVIKELMDTVPAAPRDLKNSIFREILLAYIFYQYSRKKAKFGYCTACKSDVTVNEAKHNAFGRCPNCNKSVTFKLTGRSGNLFDRITAQILQKDADGGLILRVFKACMRYKDYRAPDLHVWESLRFFLTAKDAELDIRPFYFSHGQKIPTNWKKGYRPQFSYWQVYFENDLCGHLYLRNLDGALHGTPWQYCQMKRYYLYYREPLEIVPYLKAYLCYPFIEYMVRLGLHHLAMGVIYARKTDCLNIKGTTPQEILGVGLEALPFLRRINADSGQLELYRQLRSRDIRPDEKLLMWYREHSINSKEDILVPLLYTTQEKIMRYADTQYVQLKDRKTQYGSWRYDSLNKVLSEYRDYLEMGRRLGYDFSSSFVLFPKNLSDAHDQASTLIDIKKNSAYNSQIRDTYAGLLAQYRFTSDGLTLIPPKTANEIVKEGHTLHHCVHSYVERVAKGNCVILFVRRADSPKEPFYTVEVQNNRIIQVHGQNHCAPTPAVKKFLELWARKMRLCV